MNILVHAECRFAGQQQFLVGGRDFFESLVRSVSRYAQEFLSQVHHPKLHGEKPELVHLQKVKDKNLHLLTLLPTAESLLAGSGVAMAPNSASHSMMPQGVPVQIYLTTVQLFDLVEAIDQFLADRRTLPDLSVPLQPLSKRYRNADQPMAQRVAPAALGLTSLALSAIAFFLVPAPQPKLSALQSNARETTSKNSSQPTAKPTTTPPSDADLEKALSAPEITDPTLVRFLQRRLYNKLDQAWKNRGSLNENLQYRVGVGKDGAIVGYKPVDRTPIDASKQTPLPELLYIPATGSIANQEPLAQFRVVFNNKGILQISPWGGYKGKPSLSPEITDTAVLKGLNDKLYEQIRSNWSKSPTFPSKLVYRVAVTEDGTIADYEPSNQPAWDYAKETPLESLIKPEAAGIGQQNAASPQKPLAQFRVVFKPSGVLEVSRW
jgi:hypothetical protein